MVKTPRISAIFQEKHRGQTVISLDGKIIGVGKTSVVALKDAKKKMPDIEAKEFLVSRIHPKYLAA